MVKSHAYRQASLIALAVVGALGACPAHSAQFVVTKLVADTAGTAAQTDPDLVNAWGIASSPTGPLWVSDAETGVSTIYNGQGIKQPLVVTINPTGAAPTGQVFNGVSSDFQVSSGGKTGGSVFIFADEGGTISGWSPGVSLTQSIVGVDNSSLGSGAIYKGLALGSFGGAQYLYASDFRNGLIEQFDSNFNLVRAFSDPSVAAGYAPFGAQVLNGHLFVTYALQDAMKEDDVAGAGHGYLDEFGLDGSFIRQIAGLGSSLDSPWGLDIAPSSFGSFAGDLLVGNFGDGKINAFDLGTGAFQGQLSDQYGDPLVIDGLWGLINGNGGAGGDANKVYFTAGPDGEEHGLFGSISAVPETDVWVTMIAGLGLIGAGMRMRSRRAPEFA